MAGLTSTGFEAKRLAAILTSIKARLASSFGSGVETGEDEIVMQVIDPIALEIEEVWNGTETVYDMFNPANAEGVPLDNIGAITSTPRVEGAYSTVTVNCSGTAGSVIPQYFQRAVETTGEIFQTTAAHTLPASGSQPLAITMTALNDGPVQCLATTLNQGSLPSGVTAMSNPTDATLGTYDETDEEYRVNRKTRLASIAAATVVSIKAALLAVENVTAVTVFENDTGTTDADSLPPHSIKCLVSGGTDQDIVDIIGAKKGAGTYTVGTTSGTYTDPVDSQDFTIRFERVSTISMYCAVVITSKDSAIYPATGDADILAAILALTYSVGEDVALPKLQAAVTATPGILAYTLYFATTATPTTDTTVTIAADELADFDTSRTTVA